MIYLLIFLLFTCLIYLLIFLLFTCLIYLLIFLLFTCQIRTSCSILIQFLILQEKCLSLSYSTVTTHTHGITTMKWWSPFSVTGILSLSWRKYTVYGGSEEVLFMPLSWSLLEQWMAVTFTVREPQWHLCSIACLFCDDRFPSRRMYYRKKKKADWQDQIKKRDNFPIWFDSSHARRLTWQSLSIESTVSYISRISYLRRNWITIKLGDSAPFSFQFFRGFLSRISVTWIDHKLRNFQIIRPHIVLINYYGS